MTGLHWACSEGAVEEVERLLEQGADVDTQDSTGCTSVHLACRRDGHISVLKVLLAHNADINLQNSEGRTPLHIACYRDEVNLQVMELLLEGNVNVNSGDARGWTPLHCASSEGADVVVERLLERGASVNTQESRGDTPAHWACYNGHTSVLKVLLGHNADINLQNRVGKTPLLVACGRDDWNAQLINLLLDSHADVNIKSNQGDTALHTAIYKSITGRPTTIYKKLIKKGACIDAKNKKGRTPYDLCFIPGNNEERNSIKNVLEKHIVKLITAGLAVDIGLNTFSDELKCFKAECVKELDKMKDSNLHIVFLQLRTPWYLKNPNTIEKLTDKFISVNFLKDFPLYGNILKNTLEEAEHRLDLLDKALVSFNSGTRMAIWSWKLPDVVKYKILDYLNTSDLKSFIESG